MNTLILICAILVISSTKTLQFSEISCETRKSTGLICDSSCSKLSYCFKENGKWESVLIQECPENTFCDILSGNCSKTPRSCQIAGNHCSGSQMFNVLERKCVNRNRSSTSSVTCEAIGNIPDPDNCYSYYECDSNLEAAHKSCPANFHFNIKYGFCRPGDCPYEC